jgi:hypothetical protein
LLFGAWMRVKFHTVYRNSSNDCEIDLCSRPDFEPTRVNRALSKENKPIVVSS